MSRELARLGAPVTVRVGSLLQVRGAPGLAARLRRVPGVQRRRPGRGRAARPGDLAGRRAHRRRRAARAGSTARASASRSSTSASATAWRNLLGKELPPLTQIDAIQSFDHTSGKPDITGLSNDDQPTGHGANVAQVVWDLAPGARYTFVNYHTQLELSQAVDWLVNGPDGKPRVDIVVHSNSFLDGPFDGTGVAAKAVDRAHAAGIFWANSAGNYAHRHWEGVAGDTDKDGWADIGPLGRGYLTFPLTAGVGMGATLYWSSCTKNGAAIAASSAHYQLDVTDTAPSAPVVFAPGQSDASQPAGSVGYVPAVTRHVRAAHRAGDARRLCNLEIFGGGLELGDEATVESSVPTPGDARGSFTVGARDWEGDAAAVYSSQGPTEDGRLKPDVVAPASTAVWPGIAMVGTSASAPHAAGCGGTADAARPRSWAAERPRHDRGPARRGRTRHRAPRPDEATGAGRLRLDLDPPVWVSTAPSAGQPVGDSARFDVAVDDAGTIDATGVSIDGVALAEVPGLLHQRLDMRALAPGPHTAVFWARDMAGNRSEQSVVFVRDVTPPTLAVAPAGNALEVTVGDAESRTGTLVGRIDDPAGAQHWQRTLPLTFAAGSARARIGAPVLARGPLRVHIQAFDEVGHPSAVASAALAPGSP